MQPYQLWKNINTLVKNYIATRAKNMKAIQASVKATYGMKGLFAFMKMLKKV